MVRAHIMGPRLGSDTSTSPSSFAMDSLDHLFRPDAPATLAEAIESLRHCVVTENPIGEDRHSRSLAIFIARFAEQLVSSSFPRVVSFPANFFTGRGSGLRRACSQRRTSAPGFRPDARWRLAGVRLGSTFRCHLPAGPAGVRSPPCASFDEHASGGCRATTLGLPSHRL